MYQLGGNASPVAKLTLQAPRDDAYSFPVGTKVYGKAKAHDRVVVGTLLESVAWGANTTGSVTLKVLYFTSLFDEMPEESQCRVGGYYTFARANMNGCKFLTKLARSISRLGFSQSLFHCMNSAGFTDVAGTVELVLPAQSQGKGQVFPYVYDIRHDNVNYLTLQSLSTDDVAEHKACAANDCPYFDDFAQYLAYYGNPDFGNRWIMAASTFDTTQFASQRGSANFGPVTKIGVAEAMIIGILEMNLLLKIIQGIEQASAQCQEGCGTVLCNEDAVHFLDRSVAMYCGSIEGPEGTGEGVFQYALAQRRSIEFGVDKPGQTTNDRIMVAFQDFQDLLLQGACAATVQRKQDIISLLKVPLVQSVLRFAYIRDHVEPFDLDDEPKAEAFGATYAAAILPLVHQCHRADANVIYENLRMGSETLSVSFHRVKEALEKNYECMGISCEDVGGIWTEEGFADGAGPCSASTLASSSTNKKNTNKASQTVKRTAGALSVLFLTVALLAIVSYRVMRRRRAMRETAPLGRNRRLHIRRRGGGSSSSGNGSGNIAAVSTIS